MNDSTSRCVRPQITPAGALPCLLPVTHYWYERTDDGEVARDVCGMHAQVLREGGEFVEIMRPEPPVVGSGK